MVAVGQGRLAVREALVAVERLGNVGGGRHEHVDEQRQQRRRREGVGRVGPVGGPLEEDAIDQVAEDALEEQDLGHELEEHLLVILVLEVVEEGEEDADRHLDDTDHNRDLHLERVEEGDLVLRVVPNRVDADRVRIVVREEAELRLGGARHGRLHRVHPASATEPIHREGKDLVVKEADVCAEDAVEQDDVPPAVAHLNHVVEARAIAPLLLLCDQPVAEGSEEGAVAKIAEHDAEEEWEEDAAEGARVGLAVSRGTIRVDEGLETRGEFGDRDVGRRRQARVELVDDRARVEPRLVGSLLEREHQILVLDARDPALGDEDVPFDVKLAHVEGVIHHLLLAHNVLPCLQVLGSPLERSHEDSLAAPEHTLGLLEPQLHLGHHLHAVVVLLGVLVKAGAKVRADLRDLVAHHLSREQHHEEDLVHLLQIASLRVGVEQLLFDVFHFENSIATGSAVDHAL
mmetsp:Transcript_53237/g.119500  ORF Transcript_53237/g.119500 Transcript_53237/m.119500 type:complete len:460 (-) Transcript_53237:588-1967(-)